MSRYKESDLLEDTKRFLNSEYGKYIVTTLEATGKGHLASVADIRAEHPERYAAKYSALKEVLDLIYSPLEDDTLSHGL